MQILLGENSVDELFWSPYISKNVGSCKLQSIYNKRELYEMMYWGEPNCDQPWILWLHGSNSDVLANQSTLELVQKKLGCFVVAPEYPKFSSTKTFPSKPLTMMILDHMNQAIDAMLVNWKLKWENCIVWGFSMGGHLTLQLAK